MRINLIQRRRSEQGSIIAYFIFLLVVVTAIASVCAFVTQTLSVTHRHNEMVEAMALAEGGATLAAAELESALTNQSATLPVNLATIGYSRNTALSSSQSNVYERIISTPFVGRTVTAQIWTTNVPAPTASKIIGTATVGKVTQSASLQLQVRFAYGAALVSDNFGSSAGGVSRSTALGGNVAFSANSQPGFVLDGSGDYAVRANGNVHVGNNVTVLGSISEQNANTANEIPDYTAEGLSDQLFDFNRFIAVADLTPSGPSPSRNNHFTNMNDFRASLATNSAANPYQGVIVVDIHKYREDTTSKGKPVQVETGDFADLTQLVAPNGINVQGTLVFNFAADVRSTDELLNTATLNINPANLSGLNPANPATFTTGYPATYSDSAKNPVNIDITSRGFQNFAVGDDLPALMYNIGRLDIEGRANVCGVLYTPNFAEIVNSTNQTQYFKGMLIVGGGIYVENTAASAATIISYDPNALDRLATSGNKGKRLRAMYWQ